jgi:hypothetical protein
MKPMNVSQLLAFAASLTSYQCAVLGLSVRPDGSLSKYGREECYGCAPLEHAESVHDAKVVLDAIFKGGSSE